VAAARDKMRSRRVTSSGFAAVVCGFAALALACAGPSEEAQVKAFMKETVSLAEKKDLTAVLERLSDDYADFEGRDKAATRALIAEYFRHTGIVIHLLSVRVEGLEPGSEASVRTEALLSAGAAEVFRKLIRYAGECYRFDLRLKKMPGGDWRIASAAWESVPLSGLLPESLAVLKKLFPEF